MVITDFLEKNARLQGNNICLVEVNPSEERDKAVTWQELNLIESSHPGSPYRRELSWREFDQSANRFANLLLSRGMKKGDKVVTIGGIHGVVSSTKEKTVVVKVDDNTKIEFNRTAIASVVTDKPADVKEEKSKKDKKEAEETSTEDSAETK